MSFLRHHSVFDLTQVSHCSGVSQVDQFCHPVSTRDLPVSASSSLNLQSCAADAWSFTWVSQYGAPMLMHFIDAHISVFISICIKVTDNY